MRLYVIRHAQSLENTFEAKVSNCELSELGQVQSYKLMRYMEQFRIDGIFCSPFIRTIQTITPLAKQKQLPIVLVPEMAEHFVNYEGYPDKREYRWESCDEITSAYPHTRFIERHDTASQWWPEFPEPEESLEERVTRFYETDISPAWGTDASYVVVGHGASTSMLKKRVLPESDCRMSFPSNAVVFEYALNAEGQCVKHTVHADFLGEQP